MAMRRAFTRLLPLLLFAPLLAATEDPRARLDFWKTNYGELRPADDPRAARAYEIFARVLAAAGKRAGVEPRLFIAKGGGAAVPWPSPCPTAASSSPPRSWTSATRSRARGTTGWPSSWPTRSPTSSRMTSGT